MFCPRCGTANPDAGKYCVTCGNSLEAGQVAQAVTGAGVPIAPTQPRGSGQPAFANPPTSGKAIASLICGVFAFMLPASIAAIILGHISLSEIRKAAGRIGGAGIATAGLILGYIGVAIIPFILIVAAIEASAVGSLRVIATAAQTYSTEFQNGFPSNLDVLSEDPAGSISCNHANLLDAALVASRQKSGYVFTYTPKFPDNAAASAVSPSAEATGCTSAGAIGFEITADPVQRNTTGARNFFTDQSGVIRYSNDGTATADSAPIR